MYWTKSTASDHLTAGALRQRKESSKITQRRTDALQKATYAGQPLKASVLTVVKLHPLRRCGLLG